MKISKTIVAALVAGSSVLLNSCAYDPYMSLGVSASVGNGLTGVSASAAWTNASYDTDGFPIYGYSYGRPVYGYTAAGVAIFTIAALTAACYVPYWAPAEWYIGTYYYPRHIHRCWAPPCCPHHHHPHVRPDVGPRPHKAVPAPRYVNRDDRPKGYLPATNTPHRVQDGPIVNNNNKRPGKVVDQHGLPVYQQNNKPAVSNRNQKPNVLDNRPAVNDRNLKPAVNNPLPLNNNPATRTPRKTGGITALPQDTASRRGSLNRPVSNIQPVQRPQVTPQVQRPQIQRTQISQPRSITPSGNSGFSRPSGSISRPAGGMTRPTGGMSRPSGGMSRPAGGGGAMPHRAR